MALVSKAYIKPSTIGANKESFPLFRCPKCWIVGFIDLGQFRGLVSIQCSSCDYSQTRNWSGEIANVQPD